MTAGFTARTQKPGAGTRASQARDEGRHHLEIHILRDALGVTRGQRPFPDEEILKRICGQQINYERMTKESSPHREEMITEDSLEHQKENNIKNRCEKNRLSFSS